MAPSWGKQGAETRRRRRRLLLRDLLQATIAQNAPPQTKAKTTRAPRVRRDSSNSAWAKFMRRPGVKDPTHRDGQLFRKRFRLPYPIYVKIMALIEKHADFLLEDTNAAGQASAPLYLKVLSALRVLGRGECFDTCEELTDISSPTLRHFFHKFTDWLQHDYDVWVRYGYVCQAP